MLAVLTQGGKACPVCYLFAGRDEAAVLAHVTSRHNASEATRYADGHGLPPPPPPGGGAMQRPRPR